MDEFQLWTLWSSNRIGDNLSFVGSVLAIWLALRVALATRNSNETTLITKILSTAFGLLVVAGTRLRMTHAVNNWVITASNLNALEDKSETAKGFIEYVGTTEVPGMPTPMGIAFLAVVTLMIVGQIWLPKK